MSSKDRLETLLERLVALSKAGQVAWARSGSAPSSYEYLSPDGAKTVIDCRDDDGRAPFDLHVYSPDGEVVATLNWIETARTPPPPRNVQLRQLWEVARDTVSGASEIIQNVLDALPGSETSPA